MKDIQLFLDVDEEQDPLWCFEKLMSYFRPSLFSDEEWLCSEPVRMDTDADLDTNSFILRFGIIAFFSHYISFAEHFEEIAFLVLRWINTAIRDMQELLESGFRQFCRHPRQS